MPNPATITLKGSDGVGVKIAFNAILGSELIREQVDTREDESAEIEIPVPQSDSATIALVKEYVEYHETVPAQVPDKEENGVLKKNVDDNISEWDKGFLYRDLVKGGNIEDHDTLIKVVNCAHFLRINNLKELCCMWIATMMKNIINQKDKNNVTCAEELRDFFGVERGYTDEEYEKVKFINAWSDE